MIDLAGFSSSKEGDRADESFDQALPTNSQPAMIVLGSGYWQAD
jgi:hypothetical protein